MFARSSPHVCAPSRIFSTLMRRDCFRLSFASITVRQHIQTSSFLPLFTTAFLDGRACVRSDYTCGKLSHIVFDKIVEFIESAKVGKTLNFKTDQKQTFLVDVATFLVDVATHT